MERRETHYVFYVPVLVHSDKDLMKKILKRLNDGEAELDDYKELKIL